MKRILNEHTGTIHKSRGGTTSDEAECGALRHVPQRQVTSIPTGEAGVEEAGVEEAGVEEAGVEEGVERCGRCFEQAGGY